MRTKHKSEYPRWGRDGGNGTSVDTRDMTNLDDSTYISAYIHNAPTVGFTANDKLRIQFGAMVVFLDPPAVVAMLAGIKEAMDQALNA